MALAGSAVVITASAAGYNLNLGGPFSNTRSTGAGTSADRQAAGGSTVCTDFINHLTADLGTDQSKLDAAFQQAIGETLADQVKAGKLTQQQANAIKARLAGKEPCSLKPSLTPGAAEGAYMQQLMAAAAGALGLTPDQLKADLQKGMSLSQIAAAHNPPITEAEFRASLIAKLKPLLDQAVTNGKLTSAQEQKILQRLQSGPIPFWDKAPKHPASSPSPVATNS